jgi:hypothetical protein
MDELVTSLIIDKTFVAADDLLINCLGMNGINGI